MPLPGGASDKYGNRYEGLWTVFRIIEVMNRRASSIRFEPPGLEEEGAEFWVRRNNIIEYHQVKRQHGANGRWTLADLSVKGVLRVFFNRLNAQNTQCFFVSTHAAFQLDELADRARKSSGWKEFEQAFLSSEKHRINFNNLRRYWNDCSEGEAYAKLKCIYVETISENSLRTFVESQLSILVDADPGSICDQLAQMVLNKVHEEIADKDIWDFLKSRGYIRRNWGQDPTVVAAVNNANNRYLSSIQSELIRNKLFKRDECTTVINKLTSGTAKQHVLLLGQAGIGKSSILLQVIETLGELELPVFAFRIDYLNPTQLPKEVGKQLGIPDSPANVLAAIANDQDCVLVIDQLDAVSLASGRNPTFFGCINEIIRQAEAHSGMHLLIACRKFDLENDHRMRRLSEQNGIADVVSVNPLNHDKVREVTTELGLQASRLNENQLDLLSIPLHLKLLSEAAKDASTDVLDFKTANDLYAKLWDFKQKVIEQEHLGRTVQWANVIDILCEYMSKHQRLSVPEIILDDYTEDVRAMTSEHVLIYNTQRYAFFHEGFFDYAFARRFAAKGAKLLGLLRNSEQHLFRRAQIRQILNHERDLDRNRYLTNISGILHGLDIRLHLKKVIFDFLSTIQDPTLEEWQIFACFIEKRKLPEFIAKLKDVTLRLCFNTISRLLPKAKKLRIILINIRLKDSLSKQVWNLLYKSNFWFKLLDDNGIIENWLADDDEKRVEETIIVLAEKQRDMQDRIVELLEPYRGTSEIWRKRLVYLLQWSRFTSGNRFFEFFLKLIDCGDLDEAIGSNDENRNFWRFIYFLPKAKSEWACIAIGHYLKRCLHFYDKNNKNDLFDRRHGLIKGSQTAEKLIRESAAGAPKQFVDEVLPIMQEIMEFTSERKGQPPWPDAVWAFRSYGFNYGIKESLLTGMEEALRSVAANSPNYFAKIAKNIARSNFETMQFLLIRAYSANGSKFANEACDYLLNLPSRLNVGWGLTGSGEASNWASRELVEAITPHCSKSKLEKLEKFILNYYPKREKRAGGHKSFGRTQYILLEGIELSRRSHQVIHRLKELDRKFHNKKIRPPKATEVSSVPSPIKRNAAEYMSDEQWIKAIKHYDKDEKPFKDELEVEGGARELSMVLEDFARKEPARFAKLVLNFPPNSNPCYFSAVLRGIADASLETDTVIEVCKYCHALPAKPCGRWITKPIAKIAKRTLPVEALDIVSYYATCDPDPKYESWKMKSPSGDFYFGGDILTAAINSVRGSAAEALAHLIFHSGDRVPYLVPTLECLVADPSIEVRTCAASTLNAVLKYNPDLAVQLFMKLCETDDALLKTHYVERFLMYAVGTHYLELKPILLRMIKSKDIDVGKAGSRQSCLASLVLEDGKPLARDCLKGSTALRLGAAQVFGSNLRSARFRFFCEKALIQFFNDASNEVRAEAAKCFDGFEEDEIGQYKKLIDRFVRSSAFSKDNSHLIHSLETTTAIIPDTIYLMCKYYLKEMISNMVKPNTHGLLESDTVSKLLIRVYSQSQNAYLRAKCLDLIDQMGQMEVYGIDKVLSLYDR